MMRALQVLLVTSLVVSLDIASANSHLCVLRSAVSGDVVFSTSDTQCPTGNTHNATNFQECPKHSPTFLTGRNCCVQDQVLLNECNLQLSGEYGILNTSTIPVVYIQNETQTVYILTNRSSSMAGIHLKHNSSIMASCNVQNISLISEPESPISPTDINIESSGSIQVSVSGEENLNGVYRMDLECNFTTQLEAVQECLVFKLVNSQDEVRELMDTNTIGTNSNPRALDICPNNDLNTTMATPTTQDVTDSSTTTEEPSIWLMYNKLLLYVVIGSGCGLGLVLVFIIMLCVLTGCIARRKRIRARRKHQLETAPLRRHRNPDRARANYNGQRNLSYSLTNPSNEDSTVPEEIALPQPAALQLIRAEVPTVPRILALAEEDDQVTFDTFRRHSKGRKPATPTTPLAGYYETVVPTIKAPTDEDDEPTEAYDILIHQAASPKSKTGQGLNGQYSHLNMSDSNNISENTRTRPHNLATYGEETLNLPRMQRKPSTPPPIPPPIASSGAIELLDTRNRFSNRDILTSSWSKPSTMDRMAAKMHKPEIQEIYDFPTALASTSAKVKAQKKTIKVGEGASEVIYDVPPARKVADESTRKVSETSSVGSYVDMQLGVF